MKIVAETGFIEYFTTWTEELSKNIGLYAFNLFKIVLVLVSCKLLLNIISSITKRQMDKNKLKKVTAQSKRSNTLLTLARSIARYAVYFVGAAMVLDILGFGNILSSLILTAGVGSLAIGFGAQSLVKDVVTGFFLMFENQYSVGDYIKVEGAEGTVEAIAMRVTYLRTREGTQVIVPNGRISIVDNITRGNSVAKIVVNTRYEDNTEEIIQVIQGVVDQYEKENKKLIIEKPSVLAISSFSASSVDITIVVKTKNLKHWGVERDLRLAIKKEFDRLGISIPYQTITVQSEEIKNKKSPQSKKKSVE